MKENYSSMEIYTPRVRSLLRQANRVAEAGKRAAAEQLYREIIEEAPQTADAWAGLGDVLYDNDEREEAYRKAIDLDPDNEKAKEGLLIIEAEPVETTSQEVESDEQGPEPDVEVITEQQPELILNTTPKDGQAPILEIESDVLAEPTLDHIDHEVSPVQSDTEILYCANHPNRKTHLRCNRCGKPICSSCAKPTPVGYRCPECIREQEEAFYTARAIDYFIAVLVTLPLALVGGFLAPRIGFLTIFLGALMGSVIGRVVFWAVARRRGRWLPQLVGALVVTGGVLGALPYLLALLFGNFSLGLLWSGIYIVTASGAAYYQMK